MKSLTELIPILDKIWPGLLTGVFLKWWGVSVFLVIVVLVLYLVLKNLQKKKERSDLRGLVLPPDAAPGDLHAAPTPADDHQDSPDPDRKPDVA
jgi:hypothetical protein